MKRKDERKGIKRKKKRRVFSRDTSRNVKIVDPRSSNRGQERAAFQKDERGRARAVQNGQELIKHRKSCRKAGRQEGRYPSVREVSV